MKKTEWKASAKSEAHSLDAVFGVPALLPDEDAAAYAALLEGVIKDIKPKGMVEKIWTNDMVRLTWDICQYRMFRAEVLKKMHWNYARNPDMEFSNATRYLERLEQLIAAAERRRSILYWDYERRRDLLAQRVRDSLNRVEAHLVEKHSPLSPVPLIGQNVDAVDGVEVENKQPRHSNDHVQASSSSNGEDVALDDVAPANSDAVEIEDQAEPEVEESAAPSTDELDEAEGEPADAAFNGETASSEDAS